MEGTISESNVVKGKIYGNTLSAGVGAILGKDGRSAYEVAVANGFEGSETEWLESLRGEQGVPGEPGIPGSVGETGATGKDGKSAYEIALDHGFVGTEEEWLESLKGEDGAGSELTDEDLERIASMVDLTGYAKTGDIPTQVGQLENDCGFVDANEIMHEIIPSVVPHKLSGFEDDVGYATNSQLQQVNDDLAYHIDAQIEHVNYEIGNLNTQAGDLESRTTELENTYVSVNGLDSILNSKCYTTMADVQAEGYQTESQVLALIQANMVSGDEVSY